MKILLAVDGSKHSLKAVKTLIDHAGWYREKPAVELVNVHLPVPKLRGIKTSSSPRSAAAKKSSVEVFLDQAGGIPVNSSSFAR